MRTALLAGATGLVGGHCLELLLDDPDYTSVTALTRRPLGRTHAKLREAVVDFEKLDAAGGALVADDVFACLGTTIKVAGSQERFRRVDHDYTVEVARRARQAGASRLALCSSIGASPEARSFYLRVKGDTEHDLAELGYPTLVVARPSFLVGERREQRPGEKVGIAVSRALSFAMIGGLRPYRPIEARQVAAAMIAALARLPAGRHVLDHDRLVALARP